MDWKNLMGSLSESANDDLRLRIKYLILENRILRQQINGRVRFSDHDRKELGEIGHQLSRKTLSEIATIVQPNTIRTWGNKFANKQVETAKLSKSVRRPRVDQEIEVLVIRMARENRSWGYVCLLRTSRDLIRSVLMVLHRPVRSILLYEPRAVDLKAQIEKLRHSVKVAAPLSLIYLGKRSQQPLLSNMPSDDFRKDQSQSRENVAVLSVFSPRPLRDRPAIGRKPISALQQYEDEHKAA